ncbi:MAG: nucleotide sugar dehydrogenase, partial [Candidatus Omnitrophica bacterium]|nr:nucleotide sugar dehydrogenase [Candidatus Omnitrophota bacterium]
LAVEFAKKGFEVVGIDVDKERVDRIRRKISYITDVRTSDLKDVIRLKLLKAEDSFCALDQIDVVFVCVPTPLKHKAHPDISFIMSAVKQIRRYLHSGQLMILESTTYPGTTEEEILPLLETSGLTCGEDFFLAFSPERIDPGNEKYPLRKIPKVIGGITKEATELAGLLYKNIVERVVPVNSARVAETVKLLENTFRIVNIGLIDEIAQMCHEMNIDIWEVIEAAMTKPFGFMGFYPGPGVGGHCIPKDPLYLYWKAKKFGFSSRFIKLSSEIISRMPHYVIERMEAALDKSGINLKRRKVLVIGVTYKKDVLDLRKSPALDIIEGLMQKNIDVSYYDPLIPYLKINQLHLDSIKLTATTIKRFDCVLIVTDHSVIDYAFVLKNARLVFDTRNVYKGIADKKLVRL